MEAMAKKLQALVFASTLLPLAAALSVRKCSDFPTYWTANQVAGDANVCGSSRVSSNSASPYGQMCTELQTWAMSKTTCENLGARLCTSAELRADDARTPSGDQTLDCYGDTNRVWSSDEVSANLGLNCPRYEYISLGGSSQGQRTFADYSPFYVVIATIYPCFC